MSTYSILAWYESAKRRPKTAVLPPRHVQFWLHRQELLEKYVSVHAAGALLVTAPIEATIIDDKHPNWVTARVEIPWTALLDVAADREELDVSCYLEPSAFLIGSCQLSVPAALGKSNIERLRTHAARGLSGLSYVFVDAGYLTVGGWALAHDSQAVPKVTLAGAQAQVRKVRNPLTKKQYWFLPDAEWYGFHATAHVANVPDWMKVEIETGGSEDAERFALWHRLGPRDRLGPMPPVENIRRVSGETANQASYLNDGQTSFQTLLAIFAKHGVDLSDPSARILDWGCGCARVTRHMMALPNGPERTVGIDIDSDNIAWCKANLRADAFAVVPLLPPTGLEAGSFDAVFAISVLSHLREPDAEAWCREIARVMRPGALAILTYNGLRAAAANLATVPDAFTELQTNGFLDFRRSGSLDGFISDREYYRFVLFTDERACEMFERHFQVVAVEPSCLAGGQNAAVLRKR